MIRCGSLKMKAAAVHRPPGKCRLAAPDHPGGICRGPAGRALFPEAALRSAAGVRDAPRPGALLRGSCRRNRLRERPAPQAADDSAHSAAELNFAAKRPHFQPPPRGVFSAPPSLLFPTAHSAAGTPFYFIDSGRPRCGLPAADADTRRLGPEGPWRLRRRKENGGWEHFPLGKKETRPLAA